MFPLRRAAIAVGLLAAGAIPAGAQSRTPPANFDSRDKKLELSAGSTLRSGERLTDRLLITVWEKTTVSGGGRCSDGACPVVFNGREMYARRSRLSLIDTTSTDSTKPRSEARYPEGWSRMQRGDKSENVKRLQDLLIRDGARITADGNYGRSTADAVRDFQRRKQLPVDGVAGFATLRALGV